MIFIQVISLFLIFAALEANTIITVPDAEQKQFPDNFMFGVSSSAYQIEGAWNLDGKGPSIWDDFTHNHPEKIVDHQNADVGPNSYEFYENDIEAIKSIGMNFYRFSISWSRILPTGDISDINEAGIRYYNKVINKLLENNIEPMVTMFHFDLPSNLQTFGGWTNSIMISYFQAYANLLFERFGDRVKHWITFNEPSDFCTEGYGGSVQAPGIDEHGVGEYLCAHNILKAHAVVYHLYRNTFYEEYNGQVGITINSKFFYSDTNNSEDVDRALQFSLGWFFHPIFNAKGNYPAVMITQIASNSIREGRTWSRLPIFSQKWIEIIRGSADFLGLNYYTSRYVEVLKEPVGQKPSIHRDMMMNFTIKPEWKRSRSDWLYSVPSGLGDILRWIKDEYNNPPVIVTENGWSDEGELDDKGRIEYLHDHLEQVLDVVLNNECDLKAYSIWSVIDNFEWERGYTEKFGLFAVNMSSPKKERTPKISSEFMRSVIASRIILDIH